MEILLAILGGAWLFGGSTKVVVIDNTPKEPVKPIKLSKMEKLLT